MAAPQPEEPAGAPRKIIQPLGFSRRDQAVPLTMEKQDGDPGPGGLSADGKGGGVQPRLQPKQGGDPPLQEQTAPGEVPAAQGHGIGDGAVRHHGQEPRRSLPGGGQGGVCPQIPPVKDDLRPGTPVPDPVHPGQHVRAVSRAQAPVFPAASAAAPQVRDQGAPAPGPVGLSQPGETLSRLPPAMEEDDPFLPGPPGAGVKLGWSVYKS